MKKILKYCLFCLVVFFCIGCQNIISNNNSIEYDIDCHIIQWKSANEFEIKDIFKNVYYVILQDDSIDSMIHEIDKIVIENDRIYILDSNSPAALLVFDINGRFLHRISQRGNGPGEYVRFINFTVIENDEVLVYDVSKRVIMKFDKNGDFIHSIDSKFEIRDFTNISNGQFLLSLKMHESNTFRKKVLLTDDFFNDGDYFFTYDKNFKDNKFNLVTFQPFGDKVGYLYPISDTLFIFDLKGRLIESWFFDFGRRKMPEKYKNDFIKAAADERNGKNSYVYISETPVCFKNYIFSQISVDGQNGIMVYDKEKDKMAYEILSIETFCMNNIYFPMYNIADSILVSYINSDTYMILKDKITVVEEVSSHLENGGTVITFFSIE